jgi:hypothetical protein
LNTDNTLLPESFIDDIDNFNEKPLICGGDWNLVLDEKDKKGGSYIEYLEYFASKCIFLIQGLKFSIHLPNYFYL